MANKFSIAAGLVCSALLLTLQASAQTAAAAFLSPASTDEFPSISAYLDVRDAQGNFLPGLEAASVSVVEDGAVIPVSSLTQVETNLQLVLALNTANSFAIIDQQGITRYSYIIEALRSWSASLPTSSGDDLSLATPNSTPILHSNEYQQWFSDLEQYQPAFQTASPSLASLTSAIEIASEPGGDLGASRAVLWLTPALGPSFNADMLSLAEQARQSGVRIFIWMVDSRSLFESEQAATLRALASQTGGTYFAFSGIEPIPDLAAQFDAIQASYQLHYLSLVNSAGTHTINAVIQAGEITINSTSQTYDLALSPPLVDITALPELITRSLVDRSDPSLPFEPTHQPIDLAVSFPDAIQRELVQTTLLVDGQPVAVNQTAPFDQFTWNLEGYTSSQIVSIAVEVEDALGFTASSAAISVQITVEGAPTGFQALFLRYGALLVVFIVLVAAAVLLLVFVLAGRIQPKPLGSRRRNRSRYEDPVTQPLQLNKEDTTRPRPKNRKKAASSIEKSKRSKKGSDAGKQGEAFLERIDTAGEIKPGSFIPLAAGEITIGADDQRAQLHLDHASVEPLHARLWQDRDGQFFLSDLKSTAGTWINYAPVSENGSRLHHGDLIHFGTHGYRFSLRKHAKKTNPIIITKQT
ncbi:MAG: FHA domain-containing protein [Anaerolineae bacterium]|nr:FHA domain-containing protein [Anaerolineae bacterium]